VLRYWEEQFPSLKPLKRSGGRRYYRPEDVAMVETIDRLVHKEGYTLKGARAVVEGKGKPLASAAALPAEAVMPAAMPRDPAILAGLSAIRARLAAALDAA
jgi:DNA-binding transcriptional MerR regulator